MAEGPSPQPHHITANSSRHLMHPSQTALCPTHLNEVSAVVVPAQLPSYGPVDLPPVSCEVTCDIHLGRMPHNWGREGAHNHTTSQLVRTHARRQKTSWRSHLVLLVTRSMPLLPVAGLTPTVLR